jgi:hypothetical protein
LGVRPAAISTPPTSTCTDVASSPTTACTSNPSAGVPSMLRTSAVQCTCTPSALSCSVSCSTSAGSSRGSSVRARWKTVVATPSRCNAWAISTPIGPPPTMAMLAGGRGEREQVLAGEHRRGVEAGDGREVRAAAGAQQHEARRQHQVVGALALHDVTSVAR